MRYVLYIALCLPTDTAVPLSGGEDGLLRGENCTGQLNIRRNVVAVVRKELRTGWDCESDTNLLVLNIFVQAYKDTL